MAEAKRKSRGCAGCTARILFWMVWILVGFSGGWLVNEYEAQGKSWEHAWNAGKARVADLIPFLDAPDAPPARRPRQPGAPDSKPPAESTDTRAPQPAQPDRPTPPDLEPDTDAETFRRGRAGDFPALTTNMNAYAHGHVSYERGITYYRQAMEGGGTPAHRIRLLHLAQHELSEALAAFQNAEKADPGNSHLLERIQETGAQLKLVRARIPQ